MGDGGMGRGGETRKREETREKELSPPCPYSPSLQKNVNIVNVCLGDNFSVALLLEFEVIYEYVYLDRKPGL
ncbi:hypothetical protein [Tolypothrix sp. VBCCA 56010]|uniref:hypothetical protein n=1 Tax=Tolypothrix sp. VBCCA 56010 TaxID=3137731 RepID=UPI003D7CBB2E